MDYANERYVRVYVRDTKHWLQFKWEGQTLLMMIMRKCDRGGRIDGIEDPVEDLALMTGLPLEVVERGLARLTRIPKNEKSSTVIIKDGVLIIPNFLEAQETPASDAERKRKSRELRRLEIMPAEPKKPTPNIPKEKTDYTDSFNSFWSAYPKKTGKIAAKKAWDAAKKNGLPPIEKLTEIIKRQSSSQAWTKDNGQFIPNPATWLNQGRWEDEDTKTEQVKIKYDNE